MRALTRYPKGFTILELLIALAIAALLLTSLTGAVGGALNLRDDTQARVDATRDLRFAMDRMVRAARRSQRLLVPLADNPKTNWRENVREQTVPASAPEGDSTLATAVLAVTLDPGQDRDADGFADGDNDKDGRVDEDPGNDNTFDGMPGIIGIDDDGDGTADEGLATKLTDNDEDGIPFDDWLDGLDNDGDGAIDEDIPAETNGDNKAGLADVDDDGDGSVDEGNNQNDDEDDAINEDWFDPVVFFLRGTTLIERRPNLDPSNGLDFSEYPIADNVTYFRVERVPDAGKRAVLVDITLELTIPGIEATRKSVRIRVGGGL
ncbi:MAG: MSCRAMM family adhesin SdrC [Gammaproteobacteria bacterium]|nr:MSCRAMM family adhesin SdrC [Gammaproteobacteria bacterium]